jgi:hypothetical protein
VLEHLLLVVVLEDVVYPLPLPRVDLLDANITLKCDAKRLEPFTPGFRGDIPAMFALTYF